MFVYKFLGRYIEERDRLKKYMDRLKIKYLMVLNFKDIIELFLLECLYEYFNLLI